MERIVIIDGNSLINRAYYAMQKPMITKDGIYTQGIYGFLNMLSKIMKDYSPEYLTVAFDRKAPTFRHEAFEGYKAGRKGMPPELAMEMPILKDILHAMNIKTLEMDGFEADDIIGTVSRVAEEEGLEPLIVTGDRDSFQLCTHIAKVIYTKKGVTEFDLFDHDKMLEVYNCTPKQFIDLKGLMGDKSDNIPGLPGVGEKTAMKLLEQFGSVEELIVHSDEIENEKLRNKVQENEQMAMMSKKLATINVFTPIDFEISDFKVVDYNYDELIEIYRKLEFNKFLKELELEEVKEDVVNVDFEVLKPSNLDFLDELKDKELMIKVFSNNSHVSKPELYAVAFLCEDKLYYLDKFDGLDSKISELKLIGHGLKDQLYDLMSLGCKEFNAVFDAEIAAYLINPTKSDYSFEALCNENLLGDIIKEKDILDGNEQISLFFDPSEAYISYLKEYFNKLKVLVERLKKELEKEDLFKIFQELEMPLVEVLASMEYSGIQVDREELSYLGNKFETRAKELEEEIYQIAGEEFNINSPKQLGVILFERLNLPVIKKTKTGYSTNADVLNKLRFESPIIDKILEYRTLTKLNSTYVIGLENLIDKDDMVHCHFMQTVTATGRLSCTEPNLQNIPVRDEMGKMLRKAYIAGDGKVFVGADYSQIELRVLAHLSQDKDLIDAFVKGEDVHKTTASKVLGIPMDKVSSEDRRRAKVVNFGVIYGMSTFGLSEELGISRKEAEEYINGYFNRYKAVKDYMDNQVQLVKDRKYSQTLLGRKRYINEINASNFMVRQGAERLAMNTPIQGTAADIIKLAMIKVYRKLNNEGIDADLILQIHDELIIRTAKENEALVKEMLENTMENTIELLVPLIAEANSADNWFDLK